MAIVATISVDGGASVTCHAWMGWIFSRQDVPDAYHRLGGTTTGVQVLGLRAKPSKCTAIIVCADYATALSESNKLQLMRAKYAVIVDGFGTSNRCLVHDVSARVVAGSHGYGGVLYPYRVEAELVVEYVGLAA